MPGGVLPGILSHATLAGLLLYYITDRSQFPGDESARRAQLLDRIAAAAAADVDYIQLREKDVSARELESLARSAVERFRRAGTASKLLINTRVDVAIAVGADGVHLPSGNLSTAQARKVLFAAEMARPVIGISCHSAEEVAIAQAEGAHIIVFGPVFEKIERTPAGLALLASAAATAPGKIFALGGVTVENAQQCLRAGATGVAGIRLFQEGDLDNTVKSLRSL